MRRSLRATAGLACALALAACAAQAGSGAAPTPAPSTAPAEAGDADLVLLVEHTGGFVPPQWQVSRLPLAAVYADGRVLTNGPVPAIYPGPALPNVQVHRLDDAALAGLVDRARAAGVGEQRDYGRPGIADAPSTRFTLTTDAGTEVLEVYALSESYLPGGELPGVTPEQAAARAELQALLDSLVLPGAASESYVPEAVAAVATEWFDPDDGLPPPPPVPWPGPPLPGDPLDARLGVHCVTARAEAAQAVLDAAADANAVSPWTSDDGTRWSLVLRPLLPHETGCDDLVPA